MKKTAEFVSPMHPDKICDFIADSILDAYLEKDKNTRAGIEVTGGYNLINVNGEVSTNAEIDLESIIKKIVGPTCKININLISQSSQIAQGVDIGGAGDQGIMTGYATSETENFMPREYEFARTLCMRIFEKYPYDGKTQITINDNKIQTVIVSFQNTKNDELLPFIKKIIKEDLKYESDKDEIEYLINEAGEWTIGSFDLATGFCNFKADSGLSGRKLVVDNYGPEISIGGGSFSGKDYTKVDRSGAYMARKIAIDLLKKNNAKEVKVKLAYAIGKKDPVMASAIIDNREEEIKNYDLSPAGIYKILNLGEVKFAKTSKWGHFGRNFSWDK